jgi:hypothetical protein
MARERGVGFTLSPSGMSDASPEWGTFGCEAPLIVISPCLHLFPVTDQPLPGALQHGHVQSGRRIGNRSAPGTLRCTCTDPAGNGNSRRGTTTSSCAGGHVRRTAATTQSPGHRSARLRGDEYAGSRGDEPAPTGHHERYLRRLSRCRATCSPGLPLLTGASRAR